MRRVPLEPAVLVVALAALACGPGRERPDFERMRQQQRYDPFEASAVFPDGSAMQSPPPGTVAREAVAGPSSVTAGTQGGGFVGGVPLPITPELLAEGRGRFAIYCAVCHGAGGFGGSIVAANMGARRPPSLRTAELRARPAGYVFSVVTQGKGRMPSYAWALSVRQRWAVVAYLGALQAAHPTDRAEMEDSLYAAELARTRRDLPRTAARLQPAGTSGPAPGGQRQP